MKQEKNIKSSKETKKRQLRKTLIIIAIASGLLGTIAATVFEAIAFPTIVGCFQNTQVGVVVSLYAGGMIGFGVMATVLIAGKIFVKREWQNELEKNPGSSLI